MKKLSFFLLLSILCAASPDDASRKPKWNPVKSGDGIRAFARIHDTGDIHEFKALTIVDARLETVAQIIRDVPDFHRWMAFCEKGEILERFDENNMIVHIIMDFPVVSDRDLVVKADTTYDLSMARGIVRLSMIDGHPLPVPPGIVRMKEFTGSYRFEFITRERTGVIFSYRANPGGRLPAFIVNIFSKHLLYDTLKNLKNKMVQVEKYRIAAEKSRDRAIFEGILADREKVRAVIRARMKEHYRDYRSIDRLLSHDEVMDRFLNGEASGITETVFSSLGNRAMLEDAAAGALDLILRVAAGDGKYPEGISSDPQLIRSLIDGTGPGEKCVYDQVMERAGNRIRNEFRVAK